MIIEVVIEEARKMVFPSCSPGEPQSPNSVFPALAASEQGCACYDCCIPGLQRVGHIMHATKVALGGFCGLFRKLSWEPRGRRSHGGARLREQLPPADRALDIVLDIAVSVAPLEAFS